MTCNADGCNARGMRRADKGVRGAIPAAAA